MKVKVQPKEVRIEADPSGPAHKATRWLLLRELQCGQVLVAPVADLNRLRSAACWWAKRLGDGRKFVVRQVGNNAKCWRLC